jgi:hypothetical protein
VLHRRGHALVIAHRTNAAIEIENLAQSHVERANAAADRGGERSFDRDVEVANGVNGVLGQPVLEFRESLFAGKTSYQWIFRLPP